MASLKWSKIGAFASVVGDCIVVVFLLFVLWAYDRYGVPFSRGVFCDDDSIRYPYKTSTISTACLFTLSVFIPWGLMIIWDFLQHMFTSRQHTRRQLAGILYETTITFLFTVALTYAITDIGKYSTGRLRPHFLAVCRPDMETCAEGYVLNYTCTGSDTAAIQEARLSFPSGHASVSFSGLTYFAFFLKSRLPNSGMTLLKPFLMATALAVAFYISLSRIFDYYHHPGDVLFGGLLGAGVAVIISTYVAKLRKAITTNNAADNNIDKNLQQKLAALA